MKNLLLGAIAGLVLIAGGTARAADVSAAPVLKAAHYDDRDHPLRRIATTRYPV